MRDHRAWLRWVHRAHLRRPLEPIVLGGLLFIAAGASGAEGLPAQVLPAPVDTLRPGVVPDGSLRLMMVGQALLKHDPRVASPTSVAQARAYLAGSEVAFTNLEAAIAPAGTSLDGRTGVLAYSTPDVLDALREMGFNLLSLANNHAWDLEEPGIGTTIREVRARGFGFAGTGADVEAAAAPGFLETPEGRVALVAMAAGGVQLTPETRAGPGKAGVNFLELRGDGTLDPAHKERILASVRRAAREAPYVVAYLHNHYWGEPRGEDAPPGRERRVDRFETPAWMEGWAREVVDAGADVFVVHGNPALHGVEIYRDRLIVYGLGNYIFHSGNELDRYGPTAFQSVVVDAELTPERVVAIRFRPLVLALGGEARGAPYLAQGGEAAAILGRLAEVSRPYGTEIRVEGEGAELMLGSASTEGSHR